MISSIFRDLKDGATITALGYDIGIRRASIGPLHLPTGQLVACDPLTHPSTEPFDLSIKPGRYPVRLVLAELRDEVRVAYAVVEIAGAEAARWTPALVHGEQPDALDAPGYNVGSSLGCFMDAQTGARLMEYTEIVHFDEDEFEKQLRSQLRKNKKRRAVGWANIGHDYLEPGNILVFPTGYGDGFYHTYVGRTHEGQVTRVVTDFQVLDLRFPSFGF